MKTNKHHARLTWVAIIVWLVFFLVANYFSFNSALYFAASVSPKEPVTTTHSACVGWPLKYGEQTYSRLTLPPSVTFKPDVVMVFWSLLIATLSLVSIYILMSTISPVKISHLLEITALFAFALTLASYAESRFGWDYWDSLLPLFFVTPIVSLAVRLPGYFVTLIIKIVRRFEPKIAPSQR